jgi:hypothetical protein
MRAEYKPKPDNHFLGLHTYHLQFVLPKLLLLRLIKKRKLSNMVDKNVSKDG